VRYYTLVRGGLQSGLPVDALVRFEWEDDLKPPDGDFNDYVGALSVKDCDGSLFPPGVRDWPEQGLSCQNNCNQAQCPPGDARPADLRVAVAVGADDHSSERDREAGGRLVTISVAVYANPVVSSRVAVCPVAWFGFPRQFYDCTSKFPDETQVQDVGASKRCTFNASTDLACDPIGPTGLLCEEFAVALAQEQLYGPLTCSPGSPVSRSGSGDSFELPVGNVCGAGVSVVDFQLQQARVDGALRDGRAAGLVRRAAETILGDPAMPEEALKRIDLYFVDQITNPDFRCPSGVNVDFGDVDAALGRVRKVTLWNENLSPPANSHQFQTYLRK
jgi:hypothetical protein